MYHYEQYIKRPLDLGIIVMVSPLIIVLVAVILSGYVLSLEYPFLFRQIRMGKERKPFTIYKFRTLKQYPHPAGFRPFWWGKLLRFTSLDELPQLINIIRGDMSLIGPRPLPIEYASFFSPLEQKRFKVLPGITGWAQVNGRCAVPWEKKFEMDCYYVKFISLKLDALILMKTFFLLLYPKGDARVVEKKLIRTP